MKNQIYAFSENFAEEYFAMRDIMSAEDKKQAFIFFADAKEKKKDPIYSISGSTATIKISGPLTKSGPDAFDMWLGYGGTSYNDIIEAVDNIKKESSVKDVYLEYDTPGGEASMCLEVASSIYELGVLKNTISINMGMMASAGYWLGCQSRKIYATSPMSETGSIGVVWVLYDRDRDAQTPDGSAARVRIVSKNAKNKRPDITDPKGREWMQSMIDGIERLFMADIAKGRGVTTEYIIENFGQGAMFLAKDPDEKAKDAIKVKMIDGLIEYKSKSVVETKEEPIFSNNESTPSKEDEDIKNQNPAQREKLEEVSVMTLDQLLKDNPAAKIEYDANLKSHGEAQFKAGKESHQAVMDAASKYLGSDASYGPSIRAIAVDVVKGAKSLETLETIVAAFDAFKESNNSNAASNESEAIGATPGEPAKPKDDYQAMIEADKSAYGLEVR